jgi:hypothetical protein
VLKGPDETGSIGLMPGISGPSHLSKSGLPFCRSYSHFPRAVGSATLMAAHGILLL